MDDLSKATDVITPLREEKTTMGWTERLTQSETTLEVAIKEAHSPEILACIDRLGLKLVEDGCLKWKSDASDHPRNWSIARKTYDTGLVLMLDLFT
jgi:hypothetical protein